MSDAREPSGMLDEITPEDIQASLLVRADEEGDLNYIVSTWLKFYKHNSAFGRCMSDQVYYEFHKKIVHGILDHENAVVRVACYKAEPTVILGYVVLYLGISDRPIIHWAFVKKEYQRKGVLRSLFQALDLDSESHMIYTHHTHQMGQMSYKFMNLQYNPYLIT